VEQGLAASSASTQTYGNGSGNTVTHHYAGAVDKKKVKEKKNKPKNK
jgi:hypothetical protein